ncbi:MAG: sec-independent protein translocase protein TatC [Alphaproteobacteria bacterium]|jgi:sec-independent protein translocase protein TatC|nr:sec-independent protein translocase protein TatC [Alphaproteobacteria bacterium]
MATPSSEEEAELESSKAPLLEHLVELRSRLVKSLIAFLVCFIICFFFAKNIYGFLVQPLADAFAKGGQPGRHMIFTALYETFFTYVKVGMFGAICLAFPYMAAQIWLFIAPGLYRNERKAFLPFLLATPVMFLVGAAFVYYIMMPYAIRFFLSFEVPGGGGGLPIELEARVSEYLSFVMTLIFAFGFCFELPVLLTLLGRVGIVTSAGLKKARRYAIVGVFAVAAVVTPPDVFSQLSLAFPLVGLYEISILCVKLIEKQRAAEEKAAAEPGRNIQPT